MPRYFFHLRLEHESRDEEGVELADFPAAWAEAVRAFGEMLEQQDGSIGVDTPFQMLIEDDGGEALCRLSFVSELLDRRD